MCVYTSFGRFCVNSGFIWTILNSCQLRDYERVWIRPLTFARREEKGNFPLFLEAKRRCTLPWVLPGMWRDLLSAGTRELRRGNEGQLVVVVKASEVWPTTHLYKSGRGQKQTRIKPTVDCKSGNFAHSSINPPIKISLKKSNWP